MIGGSTKLFDSLKDGSTDGRETNSVTTPEGLIVVEGTTTGNNGIGLGVCGFVGRIGGRGECTAVAGAIPGVGSTLIIELKIARIY